MTLNWQDPNTFKMLARELRNAKRLMLDGDQEATEFLRHWVGEFATDARLLSAMVTGVAGLLDILAENTERQRELNREAANQN